MDKSRAAARAHFKYMAGAQNKFLCIFSAQIKEFIALIGCAQSEQT